MKLIMIFVIFLFGSSVTAFAASHACNEDAKSHAIALLKFHFNSDIIQPDGTTKGEPVQPENSSVDDTAKVLAPVKALVGKSKFDVLEINGYIYKATYRMRFIYAVNSKSCILMGQEVFEVSDPN